MFAKRELLANGQLLSFRVRQEYIPNLVHLKAKRLLLLEFVGTHRCALSVESVCRMYVLEYSYRA